MRIATGLPPEGRAPHARNDGTTLTQMLSSLDHRPLARRSVIMTCLALRPAHTCGRGDRAPPTKPPFALSPGYPRKAVLVWTAHPPEGRALHARKDGNAFTETLPPWATGRSFTL